MDDELTEKIESYSPSDETIALIRGIPIVLIASVAGGGKNTITEQLVQGGGYRRIITNTTRAPRANNGVMEIDGQDYHFMSMDQAQASIDARSFVEVKNVHGKVYGSTAAEFRRIQDEQMIAVADIDVQGVDEYLALKPDTKAIFLLPPSVDTWLARLSTRYGNLEEHTEELETRFRSAQTEINHVLGDQRYIVVINDDLETTLDRVRGVVNGSISHSSDYAGVVAEHLLEFLNRKVQNH